MRYHTLALTAVLGYVAKKRPIPARYRIRVVMEFRKSSPSRKAGPERGSYYVSLNLLSADSTKWEIEKVENDRPLNKDTNYPTLIKFVYSQDGSQRILVDHSRAKEYSVDIKSDNRREMEIEYNSAYGYGNARGTFSSEFDQVTIRDFGPTPHKDFASIEAYVRFDEIKKL